MDSTAEPGHYSYGLAAPSPDRADLDRRWRADEVDRLAAGRERAIFEKYGEAHEPPPQRRPGGGIPVPGIDKVLPWPGEYDPNDPAEPGLAVRNFERELSDEAAHQHEERERRRHVRRHQGHQGPTVVRRIPAARPAARRPGAKRTSTRAGPSSSDDPPGESEPPPRRLSGPSPRFTRPWRAADEDLARVLGELGGRR